MGKITETRQLYKEVINELSQSVEKWRNFLDSSSWNFKYDFDDQILIYAQRPDARACATMQEWNKKVVPHRWVNSGAKPIYIFDKNPYSEYPFKLVFDLSDTNNYNNTKYKLWTIKQNYEEDIIESLEANFGDIGSKENLSQAIISASYNMVVDNIEDYFTSIIKNKKNSMLETISDDEIKTILITTTWASVSYMMMTRCGINAKEQIQEQELSYIKYFNNQEVLTILGASVSDIAEMGLREIARTVANLQKSEKLKNRTIEKFDKEMYSNDNEKIKGGNENGRENRVHETRGLLYAQPSNGERENTNREIRSYEIQLSKESPKPRIDNISNEQRIGTTLDTNTGTNEQESERIGREDEETTRNNRRIESQRPNDMGGTYEQHQGDSRGDGSERTDFHLEEKSSQRRILTKEEQETDKDYLQDKYVSALLSKAQTLKISRNDIKEFYKTHLDIVDRTEYIKQAFNDAYTEIVVDDVRLGYKTYENVLHLWKDDYLNRTAEVYYKWEMVAEYIEGLILVNEFNDLHKPVPSYDDQMKILQVEAEDAPTFSFSQELIDYALQGGSNIQESKMRIYHQFETSLSSQENIKFLKNEYGWGGSSSIHTGTRVGIDFDGKGIKLYRGYEDNDPKITLPWNKVEKRISELIKLDRYLNYKEKAEYSNWLKKQEQEKELREAEEKLENQAEQQEYELAKRVYSFVKPSDLYNYPDDTAALNTDEENIEIVKSDINDTRNVNDYVNALNKIRENIEDKDLQKHELDVLISILEKRVPHYEYHLGDTVYIGADKYEIAGIKDNIVTLIDVKFPILNKQMSFEEFERKVKDNYSNDHLIVKEQEENIAKVNNIEEHERKEEKESKEVVKNDAEQFLQDMFRKYANCDYEITTNIKNEIEIKVKGEEDNNYKGISIVTALKYLLNIAEESDKVYVGEDEEKLSSELVKAREKQKQNIINKELEYDGKIYKVIGIDEETETEDLAVIQNNETKETTIEPISYIEYLIEEQKRKEKEEIQEYNEQQIDKEKPYKVGQEVYLESDRKYRIDSIDLEKDTISLLDLQIPMPIFREESILTFENLYNQNERNFPKQNIKPNFIRTKNKIQDFVLHPEVALEDRNNYKITDNDLGVGTPREKFERNIAAIRVLKKCEQEDRYATPEEQEIMSKYVGWGGLQQAFKEDDSSWANEYKILKELLNDEEYKNARASVLTAFYTPPIVINSMYEILQNMGLKEANILEPSCGFGNFFGMLPTELEKCKMYGVELDSISGRIAGQLYQKSTIAVNAYEKVELPDSFFDVAVGNVPFDEYKPNDKRYNKNKFLTHDYFFAKTLDKVRPRRSYCIYYLKGNNGQKELGG